MAKWKQPFKTNKILNRRGKKINHVQENWLYVQTSAVRKRNRNNCGTTSVKRWGEPETGCNCWCNNTWNIISEEAFFSQKNKNVKKKISKSKVPICSYINQKVAHLSPVLRQVNHICKCWKYILLTSTIWARRAAMAASEKANWS